MEMYLSLYNQYKKISSCAGMKKEQISQWAQKPANKQVLTLFSSPITPRETEKKLGLRKFKAKPFIEKGLIVLLNADSRKGRLYTLSPKARKILNLPVKRYNRVIDWKLVGWIKASPKQRLNLLQTMAIDYHKRTSEELRIRAAILNPRFTRISIKQILKELLSKSLIETEMFERKRYYWINKKGKTAITSFDFQQHD